MKQFTYNDYLQYRLLEFIERNKSKKFSKTKDLYIVEKENEIIMQLNDQSITYELERMKTTEELYINLKRVIGKETNEANIEFLENIISFIYKKKLGKSYTKELIGEVAKKSIKKEGEKDMILEMIENENRALIQKGRREGKREGKRERAIEIAKNMLKEKLDINLIMKMTGLTKEQILK